MPTVAAPAWGARWRIPIVLGVTVFVNFLDRNNLSLALPRIAQDFGWSDRQVGSNGEWLLGSFFVSYAYRICCSVQSLSGSVLNAV
jgi:sugar phosphate permease